MIRHCIMPTKIGSEWLMFFFLVPAVQIVLDKRPLNGLLLLAEFFLVSYSSIYLFIIYLSLLSP